VKANVYNEYIVVFDCFYLLTIHILLNKFHTFRYRKQNSPENSYHSYTGLGLGFHIISINHNTIIYSNARRDFFPKIWCLNMSDHLKFAQEALNQTTPNRITLTRPHISISCMHSAMKGGAKLENQSLRA